MIEHFQLLTVTHKSLNTEDLSHFVLPNTNDAILINRLKRIKESFGQSEIIYLATCNRVLFFFYGKRSITSNDIPSFLQLIKQEFDYGNFQNINRIIEIKQGLQAIEHLFEVASSIDSLVVGEREIFRQFREAYTFSRKHQLCADNLRLIEKSAVHAAKDVYTNTSIGTRPVSVVSLAVRKFLDKEVPRDAKILLIGAGETNSTLGRFLKKHEYGNIVIFNRTFDNARHLSEELGAEARHLSDMDEYQEGYDCIFACTASHEPIIDKEIFEKITIDQKQKVIVDLSIPHNIAAEVACHDQVDYVSIDDLRALAEENLKFRNGNVNDAREIVQRHVHDFVKLYERRKVEKVFSNLPDEVSKVKHRALDLVYKEKIEQLPQDAQDLINDIASYMEKKYVAIPIKMARNFVLSNSFNGEDGIDQVESEMKK